MKTVELIGAGMSFGTIPPFDPQAERWGTNNVMFARYGGDFDAWTRWFDLHPRAHIQARRPQAWEWYTQQRGDRPIFLKEHDPAVPCSAAFPFEAVRQYFCTDTHDERDFWGSISWLIALAIVEGFERIDLFWFVLANDAYTKQVPSTRYWIGQARARGIEVRIHGDSALKPANQMYGYEALAPALAVG